MNKHLNLFYTYFTNHYEDNVTRAFLITLQSISPISLRLFIQTVVLPKIDRGKLGTKISLLSNSEFLFETQIMDISSFRSGQEGDKLNVGNGLIVGINYSGGQKLDLAPPQNSESAGSRLDGFIVDKANDFSLLIETKLWDWLYPQQIQNIFNNFFDQKTTKLEDVFVEISWTEAISFLENVERISTNPIEKFIIKQFVEYCDYLNLTEFMSFREQDFGQDRENSVKLHKFLNLLCNFFKDDFDTKEYSYNQMIFFNGYPDNLLVDFEAPNFMGFSIVCGSGKKWRAERAKDNIKGSSKELREIIANLLEDLPKDSRIILFIKGYFYYSRFRLVTLDIGNGYSFPDHFDDFVKIFTDDQKNYFDYYSKDQINSIFKSEIKENGPDLDSQGKFPLWNDIDSFLQYSYFEIYIQIPANLFIGKSAESLMESLKPHMDKFKTTIISLNEKV